MYKPYDNPLNVKSVLYLYFLTIFKLYYNFNRHPLKIKILYFFYFQKGSKLHMYFKLNLI